MWPDLRLTVVKPNLIMTTLLGYQSPENNIRAGLSNGDIRSIREVNGPLFVELSSAADLVFCQKG